MVRPARLRSSTANRFGKALLVAVLGVTGALGSTSSRVSADAAADEAELEFQLGVERARAHDDAGALRHFLASNRLFARSVTALHIARVYERLQRHADAYRYYRDALVGGALRTRELEVRAAIRRLEALVALVDVDTRPRGAELFVNRMDLGSVGQSPRRIAVTPGTVRIGARFPGYDDAWTEALSLRAGTTTALLLTLPSQIGSVSIEGEEGTEVRVGDAYAPILCTVPCRAELAPGPRVFYFTRRGYAPTPRRVDVAARRTIAIRAALEPLRGSLYVRADVEGAAVELDGRAVGTSPVLVPDVRAGRHRLVVREDGYRAYVEVVDVRANEETRVTHAVLTPLALVPAEVIAVAGRAEPFREAALPTTVVTSDMIRASGARTLTDVLALHAPGFVAVDTPLELDVAVRGVHGPAPSSWLLLLDGHRLGVRAYGAALADGTHPLDAIERIEIVRGPASATYGDGALLGVVNLVTRRGRDVRAAIGRAGAGNHGQRFADGLVGAALGEDHDVLLWARGWETAGEVRSIALASVPDAGGGRPGSVVVDGSTAPSAYDVGCVYRFRDLSLYFDRRRGKRTASFAPDAAATNVASADFPRVFGLSPGVAHGETHLRARYEPSLGRSVDARLEVSFDYGSLTGLLAGHALVPTDVVDEAMQPVVLAADATAFAMDEQTMGAVAEVTGRYDFGAFGRGRALAGAELTHLDVEAATRLGVAAGCAAGEAVAPACRIVGELRPPLLPRGATTTVAGYVQVAHRLSDDRMGLSVAARLDHVDRPDGALPDALDGVERPAPNLTRVSPRASLSWTPTPELGVLLSYAEGFADAPYWARYNVMPAFQTSVSRGPETSRSLQLVPTFTAFGHRLKASTALYWQRVSGWLVPSFSTTGVGTGDLGRRVPAYAASYGLASAGVEQELALSTRELRLRAQFAYAAVLDASGPAPTAERLPYVPRWSGALLADGDPLFFTRVRGVSVRAGIQCFGAGRTSADGVAPGAARATDPACLLHAGVGWAVPILEGLTIDAYVHDTLDARRPRGGPVARVYPGPGRWMFASVSYRYAF